MTNKQTNNPIKRPNADQPIPSNAKKVFSGIIFDVYHWEQEQYDGTYKTFEKLKRKDTVTIIPITSDGKILLTQQEQPRTKPFIGFPGGIIDEGEEPMDAAKRELLEETGFAAKELELWDTIQFNNKIDWALYTFIARNCQEVGAQKLDSGEKIALKYVTFDELLDLIKRPDFRDMDIALKIFRVKDNKEEFEKIRKFFSRI